VKKCTISGKGNTARGRRSRRLPSACRKPAAREWNCLHPAGEAFPQKLARRPHAKLARVNSRRTARLRECDQARQRMLSSVRGIPPHLARAFPNTPGHQLVDAVPRLVGAQRRKRPVRGRRPAVNRVNRDFTYFHQKTSAQKLFLAPGIKVHAPLPIAAVAMQTLTLFVRLVALELLFSVVSRPLL